MTYARGGYGGNDYIMGSEANGLANRGYGGDGAGSSVGYNGGSGVVIIRYPI